MLLNFFVRVILNSSMECSSHEKKAEEKRAEVEATLNKMKEELADLVKQNKEKGKEHKKIFK